MTTLAQPLPTAIRVDGVVRPVRWDWRSCMRIIQLFESGELTRAEQLELMLEQLYVQRLPFTEEACRKAVLFLDCGRRVRGGNGEPRPVRLYSFSGDAALIYAAFRQSHGVDLQNEQMHWWSFCSLFMSLAEDCLFCRVVALRDRKQRGRLSAEERRQLAQMGELAELPGQHNAQERQAVDKFLQTLGAAGTDGGMV